MQKFFFNDLPTLFYFGPLQETNNFFFRHNNGELNLAMLGAVGNKEINGSRKIYVYM